MQVSRESRTGAGGKFSVGPDRAVFEVLLFPNGHGTLKGIDSEAAASRRRRVRRTDGYEHAGLAESSGPRRWTMRDAMDAVFLVELSADSAFSRGPWTHSFVIQVQSRAIVGWLRSETIECNGGAVFGARTWRAKRGHGR